MTASLFDIPRVRREIENEFSHLVGKLNPTLGVLLPDNPTGGDLSYLKAIQNRAGTYGAHVSVQKVNDGIYGCSGYLALGNAIDKRCEGMKDIDCSSSLNYGEFIAGNRPGPLTAQAVLRIIKSEFPDLTNKKCAVIGRSRRVGLPVAHMLVQENAQVSLYHSKTDLGDIWTKDIVVSAAGVPFLLTEQEIYDTMSVVDVGTSVINGKVVGDLDYDGVVSELDSKSFLTPVPSGVGQITTTLLFKQLFENAEVIGG